MAGVWDKLRQRTNDKLIYAPLRTSHQARQEQRNIELEARRTKERDRVVSKRNK